MMERPENHNPINLQDPVGKVVGKRRHVGDPLNTEVDSKKRARAWRRAFPTPFAPKGVFRFRTYEEADEWMWKAITRPPKD